MLTPTGRTIRTGGAVFALGGLLFGNWPLFGAGALLLLLVASSTLARLPVVERRVPATRIERGGRLAVTLEVSAPRGFGVVEIHQALPEEFELVEGSNFHVLTLHPLRARTESVTFAARVPKRGEWVLPPVGVKLLHPMGLVEMEAYQATDAVTVHVEPRPLAARLPRDLRTRAKRPFPDGDLARMGVATNDFRELREYVPGDPPRRINWKATARRVGSGASEVPLVNETEWEGKKSVWIVVDGHARLSVGTNIEDAREHAADAALSLMERYLRRGYQVGLALARSGEVPALRFGTGEAQVRRARDMLARLQPATGPSFMDVLNRDAAHLHRAKPLVVLVTRLAGDDEDLRAAIRRVGVMGRMSGRNLVPGMILDIHPVTGGATPAGALARAAVEHDRVALVAAARAAGLRVSTWRAGSEPLAAVLVRGRVS